MIRKLIAGTAVAGALTFGAAGLAGAATPSTPTTSGTPNAALCAKLPAIQTKVQKIEQRLSTRITKAEAREAKAKAAGHTKLADAINKRITRVQNREAKVNARLAKLVAACGTTAG
jgi:hypothetical protein